jgi:hypothetical protein
MKLKFFRIRKDHFIAVPETQFNGFLLLKKKCSKEQLEKLEPIFNYMFHDHEKQVAVVGDKTYLKMMNHNVVLDGKVSNFKKHIKTAAIHVSGAKTGVEIEELGLDSEEDENYSTESSDSDSELEDEYIDYDIDEDEIEQLNRDSRLVRRIRQRKRSRSPEKRGGAVVVQKIGMMRDGKHISYINDDGHIAVSIASNFHCNAILVFILLNLIAASLALGGMNNFWNKWTEEGGKVPSAGAVASVFGTQFEVVSETRNAVFYKIPEHKETLYDFESHIESLKYENDLLAGVTADEIIKIFTGSELSGNDEIDKAAKLLMADFLSTLKPSDQRQMNKLMKAYTFGRGKSKGGLMQYEKAFIEWQPMTLAKGGAAFILSTLDYEDAEKILIFMANAANQQFENACAILLAQLPEGVILEEAALSAFLGRFGGVFIPDKYVKFMMDNAKVLYQKGKTLMQNPEQLKQIRQIREMVRFKFTNKKNKMRPLINRTIQATALFVASIISGGLLITNAVFRRIRRRYPKMNPNWKNTSRMLFMDAVGVLNAGMSLFIATLEIGALTGVFSGQRRYEDIVGDISSSHFYTITSIQFVASYLNARYYNLDTVNILYAAVAAHDFVVLKLNGPTTATMYPYIGGLTIAMYGTSGVAGLIKGGARSVTHIYGRLRGLPIESRRLELGDNIDDFSQRAITGSWAGSSALLKKMATHSGAIMIINKHHRNYI